MNPLHTAPTNDTGVPPVPPEAHQKAAGQGNETGETANRVYATCRSPRAEVIRDAGGYRSRVKVTRTGWMESAVYAEPEGALKVCRDYIRDTTGGRVDPMRALKLL